MKTILLGLMLLGCAGEPFMGLDMTMGDWSCDHQESEFQGTALDQDSIWEATGDPDARIGEPGSCEPVRCMFVAAGEKPSIYLPRSRESHVDFVVKRYPLDHPDACIPD